MLVQAFEGMRDGGGERGQSASDARVFLHVVRRSNRIAARHAGAAFTGSERSVCRKTKADEGLPIGYGIVQLRSIKLLLLERGMREFSSVQLDFSQM